MKTNRLLHAVRRARSTAPALLSPQQSISWSYGDLDLRIRKLAGGLREVGVKTGSVIVSDIPNVAENLLLQLALSHLGASVATIKDASALAQLQSKHTVVGAVPKDADSWLTSTEFFLPPILLSGNPSSLPRALAFTSVADAPADNKDSTAESQSQGILGIYGGAELTHASSIALGNKAVCQTLSHSTHILILSHHHTLTLSHLSLSYSHTLNTISPPHGSYQYQHSPHPTTTIYTIFHRARCIQASGSDS